MNHFETPSADQLKKMLAQSGEQGLSPRAHKRLEWFLFYIEHSQSVSETCKHFNIARSTFHRWLQRFDPQDLGSLEEKSHEPRQARQSAVPAEVVELIRRYRVRYPLMGKEKISQILHSNQGVQISVSTVGRIIERECMYFGSSPLHWKKRLQNEKRMGGVSGQWSVASSNPRDEIEEGQTVIAEIEKLKNTAHCSLPTDHSPAPHCFFCKWWSILRLPLTRALIVTSLVANIAFIGLMIYVATLERQASQESMHAAAPLIQTDFGSSLDSPNQ